MSETAAVAERTITLTRWIAAPRPKVWRAWTDPKVLPRWWGPRGFTCKTKEMDLRQGGQWRFDMIAPDGTVFANRHRFDRIEPESAIDFRTDDDGAGQHAFDSMVRFEIVGDGTQVTLTMLLPSADERARVENFGAVAFGYTTLDCLAETAMAGHALSITRLFDAPPERVWRAWTEPEQMAHWFVPTGFEIVSTTFEPLKGGDWRTVMRPEGGPELTVSGRFQTVEAPERLVFTHGWQDDAGAVPVETRVSVRLLPHRNGTRLVFVQTGLASVTSRDGHRQGWTETLDHLAGHLAAT